METWEILSIEPTTDIRLIKKAYAEKLAIYHPAEHPEKFQCLQEAYRGALRYAKSSDRPQQVTTKSSLADEKKPTETVADELQQTAETFVVAGQSVSYESESLTKPKQLVVMPKKVAVSFTEYDEYLRHFLQVCKTNDVFAIKQMAEDTFLLGAQQQPYFLLMLGIELERSSWPLTQETLEALWGIFFDWEESLERMMLRRVLEIKLNELPTTKSSQKFYMFGQRAPEIALWEAYLQKAAGAKLALYQAIQSPFYEAVSCVVKESEISLDQLIKRIKKLEPLKLPAAETTAFFFEIWLLTVGQLIQQRKQAADKAVSEELFLLVSRISPQFSTDYRELALVLTGKKQRELSFKEVLELQPEQSFLMILLMLFFVLFRPLKKGWLKLIEPAAKAIERLDKHVIGLSGGSGKFKQGVYYVFLLVLDFICCLLYINFSLTLIRFFKKPILDFAMLLVTLVIVRRMIEQRIFFTSKYKRVKTSYLQE